jgi:adenylate cyclase
LQEHFQLMNETGAWPQRIEFGIGIATGSVFAGNIGSYRKMEYTVIGDPANLAARLDQLSRKLGIDILADGATVARSGVQGAERIAESSVRGKKHDVEIFRL